MQPEPDNPGPGDAAIVPAPPPGDDVQPSETGSTIDRIEEGARLAKMQAAARAKKTKDSRAKEKGPMQAATPETPTLIAGILDGQQKLGPGRPPGAKNRKKPIDGNDASAQDPDAA